MLCTSQKSILGKTLMVIKSVKQSQIYLREIETMGALINITCFILTKEQGNKKPFPVYNIN